MPTYECAQCGGTAVERTYDVMFVEVKCPNDACGAFCPHVNLDHPEIVRLREKLELERSAAAVVEAVRPD